VRQRFAIDGDDFVTGRHDRHLERLLDRHLRVAEHGQRTDLGGPEPRARGQDLLAGLHLAAHLAHVLARPHRGLQRHRSTLEAARLFDRHDRIGARWHDGARHDADRRACAQRRRVGPAREALADDGQGRSGWQPCCPGAQREAIHRRTVRRWPRRRRADRLGQEAAVRLLERHLFARGPHGSGRQHSGARFQDAEGFAHAGSTFPRPCSGASVVRPLGSGALYRADNAAPQSL
jgi:hypothetical protein